ncbi:MAG: hypothetical protein HOE53_00375 [Candidatus Magasanikbacteria bacterium]|nr:hypothetical protein [Candidatus Magasanikbacteria bacterium]
MNQCSTGPPTTTTHTSIATANKPPGDARVHHDDGDRSACHDHLTGSANEFDKIIGEG